MSNDKPAKNAKFAAKYEFNYDLLSDGTMEMSVAYGAAEDTSASSASRIGVVIDPQGKVVWAGKASSKTFPHEALELIG